MFKMIKVIKDIGFSGFFGRLISILRSKLIRRRHKYSLGFYIDWSTSWLVRDNALIGTNFIAGKRCRIETVSEYNKIKYDPILYIGKNVNINDDVHIGCVCSIFIGDDVLMASKIYISDHDHGSYEGVNSDSPESSPSSRSLNSAPVVIGNNVWIGEMVCILPGVTIGSGSIIGAGAIVTKNIPENSIAVGVPAKVIKVYDKETRSWKSSI